METFKQFCAAIAAFFSWKGKKLDVDNTPPMKARAQGETDQEIKDEAADAIRRRDAEQIRKDLAE